MNILTANPEVWRKTIFILTYDENDGFFDHIPPFQSPHGESGKSSDGLDCSLDYLDAEQDRKFKPKSALRSNSIGLGFRVPMIVASPWSRGGAVCSQVFDHTSVIQLMETVLSHQLGKPIWETNISPWRRAVCGDLSSAFRQGVEAIKDQADDENTSEPMAALAFIDRDEYLTDIHRSQFKNVPQGVTPLSDEQIIALRSIGEKPMMPQQEAGTRPACPLPYELVCDGSLNAKRTAFEIVLEAKKNRFGDRSSGAPFIAYIETTDGVMVKHYAVEAGGRVVDSFELNRFSTGVYSIRVHGPNGFYRYWTGDKNDPELVTSVYENCSLLDSSVCKYMLHIRSQATSHTIAIQLLDNAYGNPRQELLLAPQREGHLGVDLTTSQQWYDFTLSCHAYPNYQCVYAGHVENGRWTTSDPQMS